MNVYKIFASLMLGLSFLLSACGPAATPVPPSDPSVEKTKCVYPESDNKYSWAYNACVTVSTITYKIIVTVADQIVSNTQLHGSGSGTTVNGVGSVSYRMWQDGKGLLPAEVVSLDPAIDGISAGTHIILKTTDLKAMALPAGATATFICNLDNEVLSPVQSGQVLTSDKQTYELDDCRMTSPAYKP